MSREKALEILKATDVFSENELEMIMEVASPDAIEDMEILCNFPRDGFNFLEYSKERFVQDGKEKLFWKGYFGYYKHDEK